MVFMRREYMNGGRLSNSSGTTVPKYTLSGIHFESKTWFYLQTEFHSI